MSFNVGEMVGPYRIIEQLGQGGMATVYKAYHAALDRYVALKVLHPAFLEDSNFLARFQREAKLVAKLDHPNIVPIYDYAEHEGRPYLVMKFIEGETLKARLARGPVEAKEISDVVESVGAALAYAHKRGILHRDVKPSNVLLTPEGQIYLADFGLARIAQSGESTLTSDMILGTPQYISPEQALGKKDLDEGTDIYSFGVMLYELMVGKVPFSADTPFSVIHDHIYTPLPMPRQVNPNVSESVERVLLKALAKERHDRYKDVHALVDAFQHAWQEPAPEAQDSATRPVQAVAAATLAADASPTVQRPPVTEPIPVPVPVPLSVETPAPPPEESLEKVLHKFGRKRLEAHLDRQEKKRGPGCFTVLWRVASFVLFCVVVYWAFGHFSRQIANAIPPFRPIATQIAPFQTPQTVFEIAQAEQEISKNPNDPKARLRLALAYWAANLPDSTQDAVTEIEKMTGVSDTFYWDAGLQLSKQNAWLAAARLYMDAAEMNVKSGGSLPNDLSDRLHEAVYKAFKDKAAPEFITSNRLAAIAAPLAQIAKARSNLYFGDPVLGQKTLDQLMQSTPGLPEGQLLQAEFAARAGDAQKVRSFLAELRANPRKSDWMLAEANLIEGNLP